MRLAYLGVVVLGSFDRHDTYMYKTRPYDKLRWTYDGPSMHDRLRNDNPHTYNQPSGCIV